MGVRKLPPDPYLFIKSISEQGYSLSTAISDLIDNSIAAEATRVDLLFDYSRTPFNVFIADNGNGMTRNQLIMNMRFPSEDPEKNRESFDLGRFGLGLKTASFSQTRRFTVISRSKTGYFESCTWDLNHLKKGNWELILNSKSHTEKLVAQYSNLSGIFLNHNSLFSPKTIILWEGLYKIDRIDGDLELKKETLSNELNEEMMSHLGLVFHRFIQEKTLMIRLNNEFISSFDPFPQTMSDLRFLAPRIKQYRGESITMQGTVLPARAIKESREGISEWAQPRRSLTDMEGIYIYRNKRLIVFGGWNRLVKKSPQFQLARIRVEIGNRADELFQLNIAKSNVKIPYEIKRAFLMVISEIRSESFKEYRNRINNELIKENTEKGAIPIFERVYTGKGHEYRISTSYPLHREILRESNDEQSKVFKDYMKRIDKYINELMTMDERKPNVSIDSDSEDIKADIEFYFNKFKNRGLTQHEIRRELLSIFQRKDVIEIVLSTK